MAITVKPLVWVNDGGGRLIAAAGNVWLYQRGDGTWKADFTFGNKIRNLPSKEAAIEAANEAWAEWVLGFVEEV